MKRKISFVPGYFYHIYNRGVEKRNVFLEPRDYTRFMYYLYFCNDTKSVDIRKIKELSKANKGRSFVQGDEGPAFVRREKIVGILCYCLLPNHFHLLLSPMQEDGIVRFMQKLATGYAMYFNEKYQRTGILFQGRYKATLIDNEGYLLHLTRYIHLNPLNLCVPEWKEKGVGNWEKAEKFLREYRWSSYRNYLHNNNTGDVLDINLIEEHLDMPLGEKYEEFVRGWVPEADCKK